MSSTGYPSVEVLQRDAVRDVPVRRRGRRWAVFLGVFVVAAAIGLALVYSRPPLYRASVSVLTVKPKPVDQPSVQADAGHVAVQERRLLGEELFARLSRALAEDGDDAFAGPAALRGMLGIEPVPDTNMLELRAEGGDPQRLQRVVNAWARTYEALRLEEIENASQRTRSELADEYDQLQQKIEQTRAELLAFREANDIVSLERGENRRLASLTGLNNSLNKARERLLEAQARRDAVEQAVARGEMVAPAEQQPEISRLRVEVERAIARLDLLRQKYTDVYIETDPATKYLPEELTEKRLALAAALEVGRQTVRDEARQAEQAARTTVLALQQELEEEEQRVQLFTERFKEFKALEERLARLERLAAEREERLAQIEVSNDQKYPPMQVVEWARLPERPVSPDYERDAVIALVAALGIAVFVTWLVEYLSGSPSPAAPAPVFGVRVSPAGAGASLAYDAPHEGLGHQPERADRLPHHPPDVHHAHARFPARLAEQDLVRVLAHLDPPTRGLAALVLCGISPFELPLLTDACFDPAARRVQVPGTTARALDLAPAVWRQVEPLRTLDAGGRTELLATMDVRLAAAAGQAGVEEPGRVTPSALWRAYVAHLLGQGLDEAALRARVGPVPPELLHALAPAQPTSQAPGGIDYTHPALTAASGPPAG